MRSGERASPAGRGLKPSPCQDKGFSKTGLVQLLLIKEPVILPVSLLLPLSLLTQERLQRHKACVHPRTISPSPLLSACAPPPCLLPPGGWIPPRASVPAALPGCFECFEEGGRWKVPPRHSWKAPRRGSLPLWTGAPRPPGPPASVTNPFDGGRTPKPERRTVRPAALRSCPITWCVLVPSVLRRSGVGCGARWWGAALGSGVRVAVEGRTRESTVAHVRHSLPLGRAEPLLRGGTPTPREVGGRRPRASWCTPGGGAGPFRACEPPPPRRVLKDTGAGAMVPMAPKFLLHA